MNDEVYKEAVRLMEMFSNHTHTRVIRDSTNNCIDEIIKALKEVNATVKIEWYNEVKRMVNEL